METATTYGSISAQDTQLVVNLLEAAQADCDRFAANLTSPASVDAVKAESRGIQLALKIIKSVAR